MFKIDYLDIRPGYVITENGDILDEYGKSIEYYISSNGYKYGWFYNKKSEYRLYPIDDIICFIINGISDTLLNIPVKCIHINGDLLDNDPSNLKWVEDFEEYPRFPWCFSESEENYE